MLGRLRITIAESSDKKM